MMHHLNDISTLAVGTCAAATLLSLLGATSLISLSGAEVGVSKMTYQIEERGSLHTLDYRLYIKGPHGFISPWHDIPLYADKSNQIFNMIVEIPRWSNAKMEMATRDPLTPIKQDVKNGEPRFVHNIFPHHGYIWNYGALPQTWENSEIADSRTGAKGDNDPIDIVEIGSKIHHRGAVIQVKIIGCLALVDDGETDWKLVAIDTTDPLSNALNTMEDVETHLPGLSDATYEWFRSYKIPAGKPANAFAFNGQFKDQAFCHKIIEETHDHWKELITRTQPKLNTMSRAEGAKYPLTRDSAAAIVAAEPAQGETAAMPGSQEKWYFIPKSGNV